MCVCVEIVASGRMALVAHSSEKVTVKFEKCYPIMAWLLYFIMGLTNSKHNEAYRDVTVDFSSGKIGSSEAYVGIISTDSSFTNMNGSFRLMGHVYYSHISD